MMQEVLSKPGYEKLPLSEQEFFELRIEDSEDGSPQGFVVKQTHALWSEIDQRFLWRDPEWEHLPTIEQAQERYQARLQALRAKGFTQSDMDLF
jgi:hypothetical protein